MNGDRMKKSQQRLVSDPKRNHSKNDGAGESRKLAELAGAKRKTRVLGVTAGEQISQTCAGVLRRAGYFSEPGLVDTWWAERGATRTEVMSEWRFGSRGDFEDVLQLEFPGEVADGWLASHPDVMSLTYGYVLFATTG